MPTPLPLSVLDLSPISSGSTAHDALWNTLRLAEEVERHGYVRYWLAEHHNAAAIASSAPEILIGLVASRTRTLRVGAGGIMLPNHAPLKVAELFRVLSALFPGRIDLGLGRAAGTDPRTALELRRGKPPADVELEEELAALRRHLESTPLPREPFARTTIAIPAGCERPAMWMLGSSDAGGALAAKLGLPFAFAAHMNPDDAATELRKYRATFQPQQDGERPHAVVSLAAICADTDEEASRLASSARLSGIRFAQGRRDEPMPSVDEALAHVDDETDAALRAMYDGRIIVGAPGTVRARIEEVARACDADEVMILTHVHDPRARARSYALIAESRPTRSDEPGSVNRA